MNERGSGGLNGFSAAGDPRESRVFHFASCNYDAGTGIARLVYRFDAGPELVERITFPHAPWPPDASRQAALERALELLHGIAGVSYYKAGLSPAIRFDTPPAAATSEFLGRLYEQGLAEFAHVNGLDLAGRLPFPRAARAGGASAGPLSLLLPPRALVAMGGGKDSLVGLDLVRRAGIEAQPACVGNSAVIRDSVRRSGLPLLQIRRELAPELAAMNRAGAWNGHVPVTAINSVILLCAAILYGYRYVVFANERSADEATLVRDDGTEVNHQYSKSSAFERDLREQVRFGISPDIEYFSILRPFSELGVLQRFSAMPDYHPVFSSCNRNFHLDGPRLAGRWCGDCPKCRFAALGLALFLPPRKVSAIQGVDLLGDPAQLDGFRALCRLGRDKPFECVGEAGESRAAFFELGRRADWRGHAVVRALQSELEGRDRPRLEDLLQASDRHFIPAAICRSLGLPVVPHDPA